jgi:hypothetical protein
MGRKSSLFGQGSQPMRQRADSMFVAPRISDAVIKKNQDDFKPDSSMHLKDRGNLRHML